MMQWIREMTLINLALLALSEPLLGGKKLITVGLRAKQ